MEFKRPTTPHYYIELGCVARGQQHKGIGRQMAQHVFNQAKRSGCGVYAETFNANNLPLLQRLGYKITNHPKSRPLNFWSLWRAPR
jgi:GNAT superfamily N-acetyltransferase